MATVVIKGLTDRPTFVTNANCSTFMPRFFVFQLKREILDEFF